MKINIGCGPDIKLGWVNTDVVELPNNVQYWDVIQPARKEWLGVFDFALVNHTLCLLSYDEVDIALQNIKQVLKDGGTLEVIDMDTLKAFFNFKNMDVEGFVGHSGSIDEMLCKHLVGYGRKSIYTDESMVEKLEKAGFNNVQIKKDSKYDLRPKESLIVRGIK